MPRKLRGCSEFDLEADCASIEGRSSQDPKCDKMVDQAMKNTQSAEPNHLIKRTRTFSQKP